MMHMPPFDYFDARPYQPRLHILGRERCAIVTTASSFYAARHSQALAFRRHEAASFLARRHDYIALAAAGFTLSVPGRYAS